MLPMPSSAPLPFPAPLPLPTPSPVPTAKPLPMLLLVKLVGVRLPSLEPNRLS
jgi:hypothetical protein